MIARIWRGISSCEKADEYQRHFETMVTSNLKQITGNLGAQLLRRIDNNQVEFTAITFWESMDVIKGFAGDDISIAHIEPAGRAALDSYDNFVSHHEVIIQLT